MASSSYQYYHYIMLPVLKNIYHYSQITRLVAYEVVVVSLCEALAL